MKKNKLIIFISLLSFLILLLPMNNICSADTNIIPLSNFDVVTTGNSSFTDNYFDCEWVRGGTFATSALNYLTSPNSLLVGGSAGSSTIGYANLTADFSYIGSINFSFYFPSASADGSSSIKFYDNLGNNVIYLTINSDENIIFNGVSGAYNLGGVSATRYYLIITHNGTNQFNIKLKDSAFAIVSNNDHEGYSSNVYTNFSYIKFENQGGVASARYFDNFYISLDQDIDPGLTLPYDYYPYCSGDFDRYAGTFGDRYFETVPNTKIDGKIYGVDLFIGPNQWDNSQVTDYYLWISGFPWGNPDYLHPSGDGYYLRWYYAQGQDMSIGTEESTYPVLVFGCMDVVQGSYTYWWEYAETDATAKFESFSHNDPARATNMICDGNSPALFATPMYCFYYNISETFIPDPIPFGYNDTFGTGNWLQFKNYGLKCYYGIGSRPDIVVHLDDSQLETGNRNYIYRIYKQGVYYPLFEDKITFAFSETSKYYTFEVQNFWFQTTGSYYIVLYNSTGSGSTVNDIVNISVSVPVCLYGSKTPYWKPPNYINPDVPVEGTQKYEINILLGFIISLGLGIGLLMVTHEPMTLIIGSGVTAFILSSSALGGYRLLPIEVGYGLIVILVLIGVIIWLTS